MISLPEQQDKQTDDKIYSNSKNIGQLHVVRCTILRFTDCSIGVKAIVEYCLLKITLKIYGHHSEYLLVPACREKYHHLKHNSDVGAVPFPAVKSGVIKFVKIEPCFHYISYKLPYF